MTHGVVGYTGTGATERAEVAGRKPIIDARG